MINVGQFIEVTVIQLIVLFLLCVGIIYLIKQYRLNKYERRLEAFSLFTNKDKGLSFFDRFYGKLKEYIYRLTSFLEKRKVLYSYTKRFDKYISFAEKEEKNCYYFLTIKLLVSMVLALLSLITMSFQYSYFSLLLFLFACVLGFFIPDIYWVVDYAKKRKKIESDLIDAIIIMNNSFKAGNNIGQAMSCVISELEGPISDEFRKIEMDVEHGLSLEIAFERFYERVLIDDAKYITSSLSLLSKTGGNIVKVFNLIEKTFFDKKKLRNELKSLTSSSVFIFRMLQLLPFVLVAMISLLNPTYFLPFFASTLGVVCLIFITLLYILYVLVIKKVLKVNI